MIQIGEYPNREGVVKTPERVARAWEFLAQGYNKNINDVNDMSLQINESKELKKLKEFVKKQNNEVAKINQKLKKVLRNKSNSKPRTKHRRCNT